MDDDTKQKILYLYFKQHLRQAEIAAALFLPLEFVANFLDGKVQ